MASLADLLRECSLDKYHDKILEEGYVEVDDLEGAGDSELDELATKLGMKKPEIRRLKKKVAPGVAKPIAIAQSLLTPTSSKEQLVKRGNDILKGLKPLPDTELEYDFFMSHYQRTGGVVVNGLKMLFEKEHAKCWTDQNRKKKGE